MLGRSTLRRRRWSLCLAALAAALAGSAALAGAEVVQRGDVRVRFEGSLEPKALPRDGLTPVRVVVGARITALKGSDPPRLRRISIAINGAGRFDPAAVPVCTMGEIQPSTTRDALKACGPSLVGTGTFAATVLLPRQSSFPAQGELYAFAGRYEGRPAILAHVYGTEPVPTSFTLPFVIRTGRGELGTVLTASPAGATGRGGYITGLSLDLDGSSGPPGDPYLGASCPAPEGFGGATFPFARVTLDLGGQTVRSTLIRNCRVRG